MVEGPLLLRQIDRGTHIVLRRPAMMNALDLDAAARGLVNRSYPAERLERSLVDRVDRLLAHGRAALEPLKRLVVELSELSLQEAFARERTAFVQHVFGPVGREGLERLRAPRREPA